MNLTYEQIKSVAVGAIRIEQQEDGIHFGKCTKRQQAAFRVFSEGFETRALTTTGVRLDFHTNSKHLAFDTANGKKFEVYLDNVLRAQFDCDALREEGRPAELDLTDPLGGAIEESRVTLVFPSHEIGVLKYVELDDGATVLPHKFDRKILFIGDSITQGWHSEYDSFSYAWRVTRFFNAESIIQGIGGAYFHDTTFDTLDFDPDTVIVALGTNDCNYYKRWDDLDAQVESVLSLVAKTYAGKRIFAISPIWRSKQEFDIGTFREVRERIIEKIERFGLIHIDGLTLVPPMSAFMKDETLHPDDLGFSLYAENLIAQMVKHDLKK